MNQLRALPKEKLILFGLPVLGLVVGILGYVALVMPQKSKASHLSTEIATARAAQVAASHKPKAKQQRVPVHAADIFRLTKAMPDTTDVSGVLLELSRVAGESTVSVQSVKPATPIPLPQGYGAFPLDVTIQGTFPHVNDFLQHLRNAVSIDPRGALRVTGRLLVADQVGLTSSDGRTVTATLSLNAFVYGMSPAPVAPTTTTSSDTTSTTTTTPTGSAG